MKIAVVSLVLALLHAPVVAAQAQVQATSVTPSVPLQPADMFALQRVAEAQVSPDGKALAYVRVTPNVGTDREDRSIWLVDVRTGAQRRLAAAGSSPRWAPDSQTLAYLAGDANGVRRVFVTSHDGSGAPRALTPGDGDAGDFAWSSDGSAIAFTRFIPRAANGIPISLPSRPTGSHWAPEPHVFTGPRYKEDGAGYATSGRMELFVASIRTGAERRISPGSLSVEGVPGWSPTGDRLVVAATSADDLWHDTPALWDVNLVTGATRRLTSGNDAYLAPRISPDGRTIAYLHYDPHRMIWQQHLALMDRDGGNVRDVQRSLDRDIEGAYWTRDGGLLFSYADAGEYAIARTAEEDGRIDLVHHVASNAFSVAKDGMVGFVSGSPERPNEAAIAGPGGTRVLTWLNADLLRRREIGQVRPLAVFSSYDRMPVPTWMILPPGYRAGQVYPTILFVHGGPWGSEGPQWHTDLQLMAAAGYVVLYANPRGSTSYGWEHTIALPVDAPAHDYDDLISAVDAGVASGIVDPSHLYVTGSSYGGIMTTWIVGKTNRFRAAVAEKPAVDLAVDKLENDQYHYLPLNPLGLPWRHPEAWWARSPLSLVGNVATPTMLVVGEEDARTPPGQAQMFYNALQVRHVPTALVIYPGASHATLGGPPSQFLSKTAYTLAWFGQHR